MVHMIGQSIGAYTDATHGMTLSGVSLPYYRIAMKDAPQKFARFAKNVWNVEGANDAESAEKGLAAMEEWMKELGLCLHIAELGVTEEMFEGISKGVFLINSGYHKFTHEEIVQILRESM